MALLISPNQPDSPVYARDPKAGFTLEEIERHLDATGKAFRLNAGGLLLVESLLCGAQTQEINMAATCLLRHAVDHPGTDVCGLALLLGPEESDLLSESVQAALLLQATEVRTVLLLDRNDEVRQTIALGLETHGCRVIQARMAAHAVGFCQKHNVQFVVADIASLEPHALDTLGYLREAQPQAVLLLISGYDRFQVEQWFPRLLDDVQFLQKPFNLAVLSESLRLTRRSPKRIEAMTCENHDSS
ncbi:MAG TPA: hypothetical protein VG759_21580 [Candidatus Angelobacter sp.]|nr:hypothetical protein [Candidatus Angelobacter sp.]